MTSRVTSHALISSLAVTGVILVIVARDYPMVGHDLRYYVPRLLDTELHLAQNGYFAIQWYTPTFGGGVPAFPNPQHLQHSLLQLLTAFANPWISILATTALASLIGFFAFARFVQERLQLAPLPSTLAATWFVGNGFYIEHLIVGHVGFQLFPLAAVLLYALTQPQGPLLKSAALAALVVAGMLYHAGVYLIILIALTIMLTWPVLLLLRARVASLPRMFCVATIAATLVLMMGAAKLHAVLAFMRQFPREIADVYTATVWEGLAGLALQLAGVMSAVPVLFVAGFDPARIDGALRRLTGVSGQIGLWELDTSVSPGVWIVLVVAAVAALQQSRQPVLRTLNRNETLTLLALVALTWLMIEATLARGLVYPWIKQLPVLRSLHVNPRIASVFIVPVILIAAAIVNRWYLERDRRGVIIALLCLAVLSPLAYLVLPAQLHQRSFDVSRSVDAWSAIRAGERFPVTHVADVSDAEALATGASSLRPYEPLFGYGLEAFAATTVVGDVRVIRDETFNLTNASSLVFPQENGVKPFDRIDAREQPALEAFVRRGDPRWAQPPVQAWLNWLALCGLVLAVCGAAWRPRMKVATAHD